VITPDHLERATAFERRRAQTAPVVVQVLSQLSLEQQVSADGATCWMVNWRTPPVQSRSARDRKQVGAMTQCAFSQPDSAGEHGAAVPELLAFSRPTASHGWSIRQLTIQQVAPSALTCCSRIAGKGLAHDGCRFALRRSGRGAFQVIGCDHPCASGVRSTPPVIRRIVSRRRTCVSANSAVAVGSCLR